jgi:O-antigen/teichoic acid export membrane protein
MLQRLKSNTFIWNSLILFSGTMLVNVLNYLFHFVVGRLVEASVYGEIESLISLLTIVSVPSAAIGLIATTYGARMKQSDDKSGSYVLFRYLNTKILLFGTPLLAVVFALTPFIRDFLQMQSSIPFFFLWVLIFFSFLTAVSGGILSGWQRFGSTNAIGIWGALTKFIFGVALIKLGFFVNGAVGSFLLAGIVSYGVSIMCLRFIIQTKPLSETDSFAVQELDTVALKQSVLPTFIGILAITVLGNVDMIFAKHALDPAVSGQYSALSIVAKTIFFVTGVITSVLFAMTAGEKQQTAASRQTFRQATLLTILIGLGSVAFFAIFPKFTLGIFFGIKYLSAAPSLVWFALMAALYSLANLFVQYLLSQQQMRAMRWFLAIAILEVGALYFFGKNLYTIVTIAIVMQVITLLIGAFFVRCARKQ